MEPENRSLIASQTFRSPPVLAQSLREALSVAANAMIQTGFKRHELPDTHAPSSLSRDALRVHANELSAALRPAGLAAASQRIARLFQMFPLIAVGENIEKLVENYTKAVASQPLWAIDVACVQIQHSGADYRPSEPKFLAAVIEAAIGPRADLLQIESLLGADIYHVPDEVERKRVIAKFDGLIGELLTNKFDAAPSKTEAPKTGEAAA